MILSSSTNHNGEKPLSIRKILLFFVGLVSGFAIFSLLNSSMISPKDMAFGMNPLQQNANTVADMDVSKLQEKIQKAVKSAMADETDFIMRESYIKLEIEHSIQLAVQKVMASSRGSILNKSVYPPVEEINELSQKRILVTGGAGFVGSHLVDRLMKMGHIVIVLDNLFTGRRANIEHWIGHPNFEFEVGDVVNSFMREVDQIYHLACPASPPHYQYSPIKTLKTSTLGTLNMLGLAKRTRATILLASTSEVYGDPEVHPQKETYWGNVNTMGPRSCYDEGKRAAETMMYSYMVQENVKIRIARIFNTFGPRMNLQDGRVVSNFILEALQGKDLTIYGEGKQTRSFQYVDDLVEGLIALMNSNTTLPVNLGNPDEYQIIDFAKRIVNLTTSKSQIRYLPHTIDDPKRRQPDISRAKNLINWQPKIEVETGLKITIEYFKEQLKSVGHVPPVKPPE